MTQDSSYTEEKRVALAAVRRACRATLSVFNSIDRQSLNKDDRSPVTIGDYVAQALIVTILKRAFPCDPIVAEENSKLLRSEAGAEFREPIVVLTNKALAEELDIDEDPAWGIGPDQNPRGLDELLNAIDSGDHKGGNNGRMWTIDPIDGTKGFLRGGQFAVCVSLIIDGKVKIGVIGCPNLWVTRGDPNSERGCIFVAVEGQGAQQIPQIGGIQTLLEIPAIAAPEDIQFLESAEAAHSSHSVSSELATLLGVKKKPIQLDSQVKYCCIARGEGSAYLRIPTDPSYREKIWDHAPGTLLVEEAGGVVTDTRGRALDFGLDRTLGSDNQGVVAAGKDAHRLVLDATQKILGNNEEPLSVLGP